MLTGEGADELSAGFCVGDWPKSDFAEVREGAMTAGGPVKPSQLILLEFPQPLGTLTCKCLASSAFCLRWSPPRFGRSCHCSWKLLRSPLHQRLDLLVRKFPVRQLEVE